MSADTKRSAVAIERAAAHTAHQAERIADRAHALEEELAGYVKYGKGDRAELVREQLRELKAEAREFLDSLEDDDDEVDEVDDDASDDSDPVVDPVVEPVVDPVVDPVVEPEPAAPVEPAKSKAASATTPKGRRSARSQAVEA